MVTIFVFCSEVLFYILFFFFSDLQFSKLESTFGDLINTCIVILVFRTGILKEQSHVPEPVVRSTEAVWSES